MSREQQIREVAYAIWQAAGHPEGRAAEHWAQAEAQIDDAQQKSQTHGDAAPHSGRTGKTASTTRSTRKSVKSG